MKKEETKNSTSSNLSNYSSIDGNLFTAGKQSVMINYDKYNDNKSNHLNFIDTVTNFHKIENDDLHDTDFFFSYNFR